MFLKSKTSFGQTWSNDKLNDLKWKIFEYQVIKAHQDPNFLYRPFSIWESLSKQYSPNPESHINYLKLYVRIVDFELHFPNTLSNEKIVYIWNVDLDEWNNIGIHEFSSRDHLGFRKSVRGYEFFQNSKLSSSNFLSKSLTSKWPKNKVSVESQQLYIYIYINWPLYFCINTIFIINEIYVE